MGGVTLEFLRRRILLVSCRRKPMWMPYGEFPRPHLRARAEVFCG